MRKLTLLSLLAFPLSTQACPMEEAAAVATPAAKVVDGIETAQAPAGVVDVTIPLRPGNRAPSSVSSPAKTAPDSPEN